MRKMIMNPFKWRSSTQALWISFLGPAIFMAGYFAFRGMAPFGSSSILTVDLGQQYIDLLAYLRTSLLHDPTQLLYSFNKGLGGNFYSDGSYYIFSPLNLLLLPVSNLYLPMGILGLTILRYGLASWSMAKALHMMHWQNGWPLLLFGFSYAFSGWMVANQLNVIWVDVMILLPLIVAGLERYLAGQRIWMYTLLLALAFICNYYMAYMVGLFLVLYMLWRTSWAPYGFTGRIKLWLKFAFGSLMSIGLSAFVWLPTAMTLTNSKGPHLLENVKNAVTYQPLDLWAKTFMGAFDFEQMKAGMPNIFVGSLILIVVCGFLTSREIRLSTRIMTFLITAFLILSMMYDPLNVIWHGLAYPVWYPYRFSFVFIFWLIWLAGSIWTPTWHLSRWQAWILLVLALAVSGWVAYRMHTYSFLNWYQFAAGLSCFLMILCLQHYVGTNRWWRWSLISFVLLELMANAVVTLNKFSYLSNNEYQNVVSILQDGRSLLNETKDQTFYRVTKNFERTKDDPLQVNYRGATVFSSMLEHQQSDIMAVLGQPEGDNYIDYTGSTALNDNLLGVKYLISQKNSEDDLPSVIPPTMQTDERYDWHPAPTIGKRGGAQLQVNQQALPVAFASNPAILNFTARPDDPMSNQNQLWQRMTGTDQPLLKSANFAGATGENVHAPITITGAVLTRQASKEPARLTLTYQTSATGPKYLTLGAAVNDDAVNIDLDGTPQPPIPAHRHTMIYTLPDTGEAGSEHTITFILKQPNVWLQNVSLYELDRTALQEQSQKLQTQGLQTHVHQATKLSGKINIPQGETTLMSTIPAAPGWTLKVDGREVNTVKIANFFLGAVVAPGKHQVEYQYQVPLLHEGILISIGSLIFLLGMSWSESRNRRHSLHELPEDFME